MRWELLMIFKRHYLDCLSHASYFIADEKTKTAVVVDPQRDVERYLSEAEAGGFKIKHVFLTHFHADFLAGHLEIQAKTGADIRMGQAAKTEFPIVAMGDGEALEFGAVRLQVLETPGHTPESVSILVFDLAKDKAKPEIVLTGDALFVGDVGRPDLMASVGVTALQLAGQLYDSLFGKLLKLPDATKVYPAHGAGSMCGKNLGCEPFTTIGAQKTANYALKASSKEEFIRLVTEEQPEAPGYFSYDARLNGKKRPVLEETLKRELVAMSLADVVKAQKAGADVLDTRSADEFAASHMKGSINIGLGGKYATWAGTVLSRERKIVLVAEPGKESESAMRLGRIGYDFVVGYLKGGPKAFAGQEQEASFPRWNAAELAKAAASRAVEILDVRNPAERAGGRIEGSVHIPLSQLSERLDEVPGGRPLVVYCAGGYRSAIAASLILKSGREEVCDLIGGFGAWKEAHPA